MMTTELDPPLTNQPNVADDNNSAAKFTESASSVAGAGLHTYFLVLLAVALIAARSLMSPLPGQVGTQLSSTGRLRRTRSVPRSQWMID